MRSRVVARSPALRAACCATSAWPQHVPRLLEQGGARDGELDAALAALEALDPELLLESAHLLAYCRLRDVKALRCPAEVQSSATATKYLRRRSSIAGPQSRLREMALALARPVPLGCAHPRVSSLTFGVSIHSSLQYEGENRLDGPPDKPTYANPTARTGPSRDRPRALRDRESDTYSPDDLPVSACGRDADDATVGSLYRIAQHAPRVAAPRARAIVRPWVLSLTRGL